MLVSNLPICALVVSTLVLCTGFSAVARAEKYQFTINVSQERNRPIDLNGNFSLRVEEGARTIDLGATSIRPGRQITSSVDTEKIKSFYLSSLRWVPTEGNGNIYVNSLKVEGPDGSLTLCGSQKPQRLAARTFHLLFNSTCPGMHM